MLAARSALFLISLFATALISAPASATRDLSVNLGSTMGASAFTAGPAAVSNILPPKERRSEPASPYGAWVAIVLGFGLLGAVGRRGTPQPHGDVSF